MALETVRYGGGQCPFWFNYKVGVGKEMQRGLAFLGGRVWEEEHP
jgi:hypothetical protein